MLLTEMLRFLSEIEIDIFSVGTEFRPKIKFYLFVIAYLPKLLLPTQLFFFFAFPEVIFYFFLLCRYFSFSLKC